MKLKIVIASVLKPIDDVRAFEKLGQSIAKKNKYQVNIIGNETKVPKIKRNIQFHDYPINQFPTIQRLLFPLYFLRKIILIRPHLLIITTPSLIVFSLVLKLFFGTKVIYDVQENYSKNAALLSPKKLAGLWAAYIGAVERISTSWIDHYLLAENCYQNELPKLQPFIVIENTARKSDINLAVKVPNSLLFSGTISEYSGIKHAINLYQKIIEINRDFSLTIIGQVHDKSVYKWLKEIAENDKKLHLKISMQSIPHSLILEEISKHTYGIISYLPNSINENKIPTKLYEYAAYGLPFFVQKDSNWYLTNKEFCDAYPLDYQSISTAELQNYLEEPPSSPIKPLPNSYFWETQEQELFNLIDDLLE